MRDSSVTRHGARGLCFIRRAPEEAVRLTPARRLEIAEKRYSEAKMHGDTVQDAEAFLSCWRQARRLMHKEGLLPFDPEVERQCMAHAGLNAQYIEYGMSLAVVAQARELNHFFCKLVCRIQSTSTSTSAPLPLLSLVLLTTASDCSKFGSKRMDQAADSNNGIKSMGTADVPSPCGTASVDGTSPGASGSGNASFSVGPEGVNAMQGRSAGYNASFGGKPQ